MCVCVLVLVDAPFNGATRGGSREGKEIPAQSCKGNRLTQGKSNSRRGAGGEKKRQISARREVGGRVRERFGDGSLVRKEVRKSRENGTCVWKFGFGSWRGKLMDPGRVGQREGS